MHDAPPATLLPQDEQTRGARIGMPSPDRWVAVLVEHGRDVVRYAGDDPVLIGRDHDTWHVDSTQRLIMRSALFNIRHKINRRALEITRNVGQQIAADVVDDACAMPIGRPIAAQALKRCLFQVDVVAGRIDRDLALGHADNGRDRKALQDDEREKG
jgi:hypothetical protein